MSDLIALPIGYQHEPQDNAHISDATIDVPAVICRLILGQDDTNAGFLDGQLRVLPVPPAENDTLLLSGVFTAEHITVRVVSVIKQNESYVARSGGPAYILAVETV